MTREELIAALEAATGPDRAADFWCWWWGKAQHDGDLPDRDYIAVNIRRGDAPRYTASIDAALTLVPDGMWWHVGAGRTRPNEPCWRHHAASRVHERGHALRDALRYAAHVATILVLREPRRVRSAGVVEFGAQAHRSQEPPDEPYGETERSRRPSQGGLVGGAGHAKPLLPQHHCSASATTKAPFNAVRTGADQNTSNTRPLYGAVILWPGDNPKPLYECDEVGAGEHATSPAIAIYIAALKAQGDGA